jgi:hypothetical protein
VAESEVLHTGSRILKIKHRDSPNQEFTVQLLSRRRGEGRGKWPGGFCFHIFAFEKPKHFTGTFS